MSVVMLLTKITVLFWWKKNEKIQILKAFLICVVKWTHSQKFNSFLLIWVKPCIPRISRIPIFFKNRGQKGINRGLTKPVEMSTFFFNSDHKAVDLLWKAWNEISWISKTAYGQSNE
jgi:hypothetical protein